jgi:hypothetical protein
MDRGLNSALLSFGIVLHVQEDACQILWAGKLPPVE